MIFIRYIHLTKEKAQLLLFGIVPHVDEKGEEPIGVSLDLRNVTKVLFDPCNGWRNVIVNGRNMKECITRKSGLRSFHDTGCTGSSTKRSVENRLNFD